MKGKRKRIGVRQYRGCTILWQDPCGGLTGCRMRWTAFTDHGQVAANTLADIKELIRESASH